jgi:hypothetical protein
LLRIPVQDIIEREFQSCGYGKTLSHGISS